MLLVNILIFVDECVGEWSWDIFWIDLVLRNLNEKIISRNDYYYL